MTTYALPKRNSGLVLNVRSVMWASVALALLAALGYILAGWGLLSLGDLTGEEGPAGIIYITAACYTIGGLLILARRRWLWIVGAVINALVIFAFFSFYMERPAVLFSGAGIATKTAQILLEVGLVYLSVMYRRQEKQIRSGDQIT